jgi:hypothetical protein
LTRPPRFFFFSASSETSRGEEEERRRPRNVREWLEDQLAKARELDPSLAEEPALRPPNGMPTRREQEALVRLGLIDSPEEATRKLVAEEEEDRASAGDRERGRRSRLGGKLGGPKRGKTLGRDMDILREVERREADNRRRGRRRSRKAIMDDIAGQRDKPLSTIRDAVKRAEAARQKKGD